MFFCLQCFVSEIAYSMPTRTNGILGKIEFQLKFDWDIKQYARLFNVILIEVHVFIVEAYMGAVHISVGTRFSKYKENNGIYELSILRSMEHYRILL